MQAKTVKTDTRETSLLTRKMNGQAQPKYVTYRNKSVQEISVLMSIVYTYLLHGAESFLRS